jgi:hypothetical protein
MDADGANPTQLTHNAAHDEGAAWPPDGSMIAYSSGPDNDHLDVNVMTTSGRHLRRLTHYEGGDESPDWQPIPAPDTDHRCGDLATTGAGVRDIRAGEELSCKTARKLAARWSASERPERRRKIRGFHAVAENFGGLWRVVLSGRDKRRDGKNNGKLVAFVFQP